MNNNWMINKKISRFLFIAIMLIFSCKKKVESSHKSKSSDAECSDAARIFGEGIFEGNIYRGTFSPDGNTFYFFKKLSISEDNYKIFSSKKINGRWAAPEVLSLGGDYSDMYPSISKDGNILAFSSYRPIPKKYRNKSTGNAHMWYVVKDQSGWGDPIFMSKVNTPGYYHSWVEFGWDNKLFFRQVSPDWKNRKSLYTKWDGKNFITPKVFKEVEQLIDDFKSVQIVGGSPGPFKNIVFLDVATVDSLTLKRGSDIWFSTNENNIWQDPKPLSREVNKSGYDVFPFFSDADDCLYFIRDFDKILRISMEKAMF